MGHYCIIQVGTTKDNSQDCYPGKRKRNIKDFVRPINFDYIIKETHPKIKKEDLQYFFEALKKYCTYKIDGPDRFTIQKNSCNKFFETRLQEIKNFFHTIKNGKDFEHNYYHSPIDPIQNDNKPFVIIDDDECERIYNFDYFMYILSTYTKQNDLELYIKNVYDAHY